MLKLKVTVHHHQPVFLLLCDLPSCQVIHCVPGLRTGLKLKIERKVIHHLSYALFPTLGQSTPVDWTLLELEDIEGEHIRCHELLGNELLEDLFQRYKQADSKAVVLINTEDSHILPPDLVSGVGKPSLPVLVLTKSDGQQILQCLEDTGEIEENVYAKIEAETDVDGGMGGVAEEKSQQKFTSPHGTPKKQQVHQSPPDSSISKSHEGCMELCSGRGRRWHKDECAWSSTNC